MKNFTVISVLILMSILSSVAAYAETHYMNLNGLSHEWIPNEIWINIGDTVRFGNHTSMSTVVQQSMGSCDPWTTGTIGGPGGARLLTFDESFCPTMTTEYFYDTTWFSPGVIHIQRPDWYYFPSMTSLGIWITLVLMSVLLAVSLLKR